jgi:hypothetical protein
MKSIHRVASQIMVIGSLLIAIPMILPAQTLSQVLEAQTERTLISQSSQKGLIKSFNKPEAWKINTEHL